MSEWWRRFFSETTAPRQDRAFFVLFLIFINLAFIGLFSPWFVVRWDAYDYWLPRLHWIGDCWRHGYFPDYLPYIFSGYSLGGDIQAGVYNPVYTFFAVLFADSIFSATFLYLFFLCAIYLASYRIALSFFKLRATAFYMAMSVVVCGSVLPHSEHFSFLASYVGFLGLFAALLDLSEEKYRRGAVLVFLSVWFVLTSGYGTLLVSESLALAGIAVALTFRKVKSPVKFWGLALAAALAGVILAMPALIHFMRMLPLTDRAAGQSLEVVASGSLPWKSLLGFFAPVLTIRTATLDLSMAQFNVLISTPLLIAYGLWRGPRPRWGLIGLFVLFVILCLGAFSPLPLRMWMADSFKVFRMGRFLAAEFKLFALMILIYFASAVLERLLFELAPPARRKLVTALVLDVLLVLTLKRRFVLQPVEQAFFPPLKTELTAADSGFLNRRRDCPRDLKTLRAANTTKDYFFTDGVFSADGFSPMSIEEYFKNFSDVAWAVCAEGRLFATSTKTAANYELISYTPAGVKFKFTPAPGELYLWAETVDPFWQLLIDHRPAEWIAGPGHLRYFRAPSAARSVTVEMKYLGPLSRFFRK